MAVAVLDSGRKIAVNTYKQYGRTAAEKKMKPVPAIGVDLNVAIFEVTNSSKVGRCRLTVSKPVLKAPLVSALET